MLAPDSVLVYWASISLRRIRTISIILLITQGVLCSCRTSSSSEELTPTPVSSSTPTSLPPTVIPTIFSSPTPDERQVIVERLARAGTTITYVDNLSLRQLMEVDGAVTSLGHIAVQLYAVGNPGSLSTEEAFIRLFGPTEIIVYDDQYFVDGVHEGVNCGWEGKYAKGCQYTSIYPEQIFPTEKWLILVSGERIPGNTASEGKALIAHELAHNLTWGHGHIPSNIGGFSFVRYVGDDFAIRYFDELGVHAGIDDYGSEEARASSPRWRAELTADAIASWAFNEVQGPYAESISNYIRLSMLCDIYGGPDC